MAPQDYVQARERLSKTRAQHLQAVELRATVDGKPYLPFFNVNIVDNKNIDNDDEDDDEAILNSCKRIVAAIFSCHEQWESFQAKSIPGGNTNRLFCVTTPKSTILQTIDIQNDDTIFPLPKKVLVRVFGAGGLIDRDVDTAIYAALAAQGLALQYYGRFGNGRLEEWSDWLPLSPEEMAQHETSMAIARAMAQLHSQFQYHLVYKSESQILPPELNVNVDDNNNNNNQKCDTVNPPIPLMWKQLNDWMETGVQVKMQNDHDEERYQRLQVPTWREELTFLKTHVIVTNDTDHVPEAAAVGFCHCDVLASNILQNPASKASSSSTTTTTTTKEIQLIDFEYGGWNFLSYDIANHFNEFAGGTIPGNETPNYDLFPSKELQIAFCKEYLRTIQSHSQQQDKEPSMDQVQKLLKEVSGFVLANHLVWSLWAVNQAAAEGCEVFDYLHYAKCRMDRYFDNKSYWKMDDNHSSIG